MHQKLKKKTNQKQYFEKEKKSENEITIKLRHFK